MSRLAPWLCFCALVASLSPTTASAKTRLRHLRHIVLDPGHGGENPGTSSADGVHEKTLTLPIALELERLLLRHTDAKVTLTRREDTGLGLRDRARVGNEAGGDLFLSIHLNASPKPEAHGLEVYFLSPEATTEEVRRLVAREEGAHPATTGTPVNHPAGAPGTQTPPSGLDRILAEASRVGAHRDAELVAGVILDTLHTELRAPRRGVFQAPFGVLKEANMPAVVVEVGFLSHAIEGKKLLTAAYQKKVAKGLYRALLALDKKLVRR